jgi:3-deoxy-D-manno-octulosonic-acid transferase
LKIKGIYFLYRVLQAFGLPALLFYFLLRGLRNRGYWHSLAERFGFLPRSFKQTSPGAIWLHAVSVGEVLSCVEFLKQLRADFPHTALFVSSTTLAGRATAQEKLAGVVSGVFYAPVDYVFAVRRVLRTLKPGVVAVAETEIWPNLIREVKRTQAGLAIVNGRISDRAFPRYLKWAWLFRCVLPQVDSILAQTDEIAGRFLALGAPPDQVRTGGNFKYDFAARATNSGPAMEWLERKRPAKVWIAASTMPPAESGDVDEDDAVLTAYRKLACPDLILILVPRKPERFDVAARKLEESGIPFVRRTGQLNGPANVLLLDTIGELSGLFALADVVFMGGTLARRGGHNILEPAFFGKPVIIGPHMENFQAIADEFRAAGACVEIANAAELADAVESVLAAPADIGERARQCAEAKKGATARALAAIRELYSVPGYRPAAPWFGVRWALARGWRWGARRRYAQGLMVQRRVDAPVISVGNLTMGGTGKTPCVLRITEILKEQGRHPGILTRGHGRGSPETYLSLAPGSTVRAEYSGDEPQIFLRSGLAPVGIGGNRYRIGMELRHDFGVDVLVLDDGFQHVRLARTVDILLIDALDPFGGGDVFPLGRLREPAMGLGRADIILITRSGFSDLPLAIERAVRRWNPYAPIFRAHSRPHVWVEHRTGRQFPATERPFERAGMFCGLGNPHSFQRTLEGMGIQPADCVFFSDHHRYRPQELLRIAEQLSAKGAAALVTTEKDMVNLPETADDLLKPLPLYWLKIRMEIEGEAEFRKVLAQALVPAPQS